MLILIAIIPVIIFLAVIYYRDKEKEPLLLLIESFMGGALGSVLLTLIMIFVFIDPLIPEDLFDGHFLKSFYSSFFGAAIPEELSKFVFLYIIVWKNKYFDEYYDGIVYAVTVSLGFACTENIMYVTDGGVSVGIWRALLSIPAHGFMGVFMGYYFSLAKLKKRNYLLFKGLMVAIIVHGVYDFLIFYGVKMDEYMAIFLFSVFIYFNYRMWKLGLKKIQKHIDRDIG